MPLSHFQEGAVLENVRLQVSNGIDMGKIWVPISKLDQLISTDGWPWVDPVIVSEPR